MFSHSTWKATRAITVDAIVNAVNQIHLFCGRLRRASNRLNNWLIIQIYNNLYFIARIHASFWYRHEIITLVEIIMIRFIESESSTCNNY